MTKTIVYAAGGLLLAGAVGGGIALAILEAKKKKAARKNASKPVSTSKTVAPAATPSATASAVEATPLPTMMTDDQASTWASNYPILMESTDMHASIAASSVLLPLMNLGLTADQVKKYNVAPPNASARMAIESRQRDVVVPGVTMTDDQAKIYAANWKLYTTKGTSQADMNAAVKALAPIVGLRETGYQYSQTHAPGPDDLFRKSVAADNATLLATGNVPL